MISINSKDLGLFIKALHVAREKGLLSLFDKKIVLPEKEERTAIKKIAIELKQTQGKVCELIASSW